MDDIRFYDYDFQLLHIAPDVLSAYWIVKYNDIGTFEGTFSLSSAVLEVVTRHKYLILVQGDFQALVTAYKADKVLTVFGKTPNWILSKRTYPAFKTSEMEDLTDRRMTEVLKRIATETFFDVENFQCRVLQDAPDTEEHFWRNERKALSETVKEGLQEVSLGHRVRLDLEEKTWNFEMYGGETRSVVLSEGNRNFREVSVTEDCQPYFNACWFKKELKDLGEWNPEDSVPFAKEENYGCYYTISNNEETNSGTYPNGSYLVCVDKSGVFQVMSELPTVEEYIGGELSGIYCWDTVVTSSTAGEAKTELKKKAWEHKVDGKAVGFLYGTDYGLGDVLSVQVEKGSFCEAVLMRVSGVEVWFESGNMGEKMVLEEMEETNGVYI